MIMIRRTKETSKEERRNMERYPNAARLSLLSLSVIKEREERREERREKREKRWIRLFRKD